MQRNCKKVYPCYYILCLFMLVAFRADAQDKRSHPPRPKNLTSSELPKPGWTISTNLLSLVETDAGPSLAVEYCPSLHWAVVLEGGALLYTGIPYKNDQGKGFRIQPELRYYYSGHKKSFRGFISLQAAYQQKTYEDSINILQDATYTTDQAPPKIMVGFEEKRHVFAGTVNVGFQGRFGKAQRFMLEVYAGLGLKYKNVTRDERPFKALTPRLFTFDDTNKKGYYLHIPMGIRMGYRL